MHRRLSVVAFFMTALTFVFGGSLAAFANGSGNQFYAQGLHPNAWGGGPWIRGYPGSTANNDFSFGAGGAGGLESVIRSTSGSGAWNGSCIGDAYNDPSDARASLTPCTNGPPWGGNFYVKTCSVDPNKIALYNVRWGGYLAPQSTVSGSQYYLNHPGEYCYAVQNPA